MRHYLGIDPGKLGAYVVINEDGDIVKKGGLPLIGKEYDKDAIRKILTDFDFHHIGVEDPGIIMGAGKSSVASLHRCVGMLEGMLVGLSIPHTLTKPKEWQKEMWKNVTKQFKLSTTGKTQVTDTKATSLIAALRLFPSENWKITNKGGVSVNHNDGMIDGALIAEYIRRTFKR
jgi:hypothetical protein